jgi:diketogulonate reductase-like aldo/keto reductase
MDLMLHHEVKPAVDQIETHPFHQQVETQRFLQQNDVQIESWGPFAEGRNGIFSNAVLAAVGAKHGRTIAQVILRWLTQRGVVAIPKSVRRERMAENFAVFDFELGAEDLAAIAALDTKQTAFFDHRDPEKVKWLSTAVRPT